MMSKEKTNFPWLYIFLAYGIAWFFWIPVIFTEKDYQNSPVILLLVLAGVFGPGLAGIFLTYVEKGKEGGRDFWQRMFDFTRVQPIWYVIIILLWPLLHISAIILSGFLGGIAPDYEFVKQTVSQPLSIPVVIFLYFIQAGLEEIGWRGYFLERVQGYMGLTKSSLIIGVLHTFWHIPLFFVVGTNQIQMGFGIDFAFYVTFVIASSIYTTWCYIGNKHSTLAATLLHCTGNLSFDIFATAPETLKHRIYIVLMALGAFIIMLNWLKNKSQHEIIMGNQIGNHISTNMSLQTRRLFLRTVKPGDATYIFNMVQLPKFPDQLPLKEMDTLSQIEDWLRRLHDLWETGQVFSFISEEQVSGNIIGQVTLSKTDRDNVWALAFWTHPKQWGKGYATEMAKTMLEFGFQELGAKNIWAGAGDWNNSSCRVLEKIDMEFTGLNPEGHIVKNKSIPTREYEISLESWQTKSTYPRIEEQEFA